MENVAVGVKMFSRTDRLSDLFESIEDTPISTVYVADDGPEMAAKSALYEAEYRFDLTVIRPPVDSGVGYCRKKIAEKFDKEYLLMLDSDHLIPQNVSVLYEILEVAPSLGGVCGLLFENNHVIGSCHHFRDEGDRLIRTVDNDLQPRVVADHTIFEFDYLPQVTLFRQECLKDYSWDERYTIGGAHTDFYLGHFFHTDWKFAVCPNVVFTHRPGGDSFYKGNRHDGQKVADSKAKLKKKWGYNAAIWRDIFPHSYNHGPVMMYKNVFKYVPSDLHTAAWRVWKWIESYRDG
jgi:hypothetical protein